MIRWNTFARSAVFAAVAAAGWLPWALIVGPITGASRARALYLIVVLAAYIVGLSAATARASIVAVAVSGAALVLTFLARSNTELVFGLALLLSLARSCFLYRHNAARAVALEMALQLVGLLFARWLSAPTLVATSLALWGYMLVQSCFFLFAGAPAWRPGAADIDPFERAHRSALALLTRDT